MSKRGPTHGGRTSTRMHKERVPGETCLVLLEKLCFLAEDSAEHLALQSAVHAAHGAVVDPVPYELEHCAGETEAEVGGQGVFEEQREGSH